MSVSKTKIVKMLLIFLSIMVVIPAVFYSTFFIYLIFFFGMCEIENFRATPSPNDKMSVYIYSVDCGATTGFNTRASLAPTKKNYIPDGSKQFLYLRGQHDIRAKWVDAAVVEITAPDSNEVYDEKNIIQKEALMDGIFIIYK